SDDEGEGMRRYARSVVGLTGLGIVALAVCAFAAVASRTADASGATVSSVASATGVSATNGQIAWSNEVEGITVANPDGTARHLVDLSADLVGAPVWSPDGNKLLVNLKGADLGPVTVNPDGSGLKRLDPVPCSAAETGKRAKALAAYKQQ